MECRKDVNKAACRCTSASCGNRGMCCECVKYHRDNGEIPGCFFDAEGEKAKDRSVDFFIKSRK